MDRESIQQMAKTLVTVLISACLFVLFFTYFVNPYLPWEPDAELNPDKNHTHADFLIWIEGEVVDLTDNRYMSGLSTDDASHDEEDEYLHKYLHLHDNVGHVVHQHKPDLDMKEFFESLGMRVTPTCIRLMTGHEHCNTVQKQWRMVVNGEEIKFDPAYEFSDLDKILYAYGATDSDIQKILRKYMTDDACLYSKSCPWRGDPPQENCIADPSVPCIADFEDDFS